MKSVELSGEAMLWLTFCFESCPSVFAVCTWWVNVSLVCCCQAVQPQTEQLERAIIIPSFSFYGSGIQRAERGRLPELRDGSQMLAWVLLLSCDWQVVAAVSWGVQQSLTPVSLDLPHSGLTSSWASSQPGGYILTAPTPSESLKTSQKLSLIGPGPHHTLSFCSFCSKWATK